ncbi:MAG: hypothetical protein AAFQ74_02255 [Cyanobacteria bacterium J06623_4]
MGRYQAFSERSSNLEKDNGTITIVGSYGYIPLEVFMARSTPASDLYNLGMTLVHLVTGIHPADIPQVDGKIQLNESVASNISPWLVRWLERMTHPYLDCRFESAETALSAFQAKDGTAGYDHSQSADSLIQIRQQRDRLEIEIYRPFVHSRYLKWLLRFLITGLSTVVIALVVAFCFSDVTFVMHFFLPLVFISGLCTLFLTLPATVFTACNQGWRAFQARYYQVISIDRQTGIRVGTGAKGKKSVRWEKPTSPFHTIDLLAYSPGYSFQKGQYLYYYKDGKQEKARGKDVSPSFSIHAGIVTYNIGHDQLSAADFWQIGEALSQFTGLEVRTIYPTPVVVPQPEHTCGC